MSACAHKKAHTLRACVCAREKKMNHLILGAVFWVTGESWGTDGRLALAGTWPPAAGRNERTVISLDAGQEIDTLHTHRAIRKMANEAP